LDRVPGVAGAHPAVVEVVVQGGGVAVADRESGRSFGGVGEAVQLGQRDGGAVPVTLLGQVGQDPTGGDRGQLLVVPDQPDTAAGVNDVPDDGGQVAGAGHARLVDQHQRPRPHRAPYAPTQ